MLRAGDKRKHIEDEMSRFEAEISVAPTAPPPPPPPSNLFVPHQVKQPVIASNTYHQVQQKLSSSLPPPPPAPSMIPIPPFVPHQMQAGQHPLPHHIQQHQQTYEMMNEKTYKTGPSNPTEPTPVVVSSAPKLYTNRTPSTTIQPSSISDLTSISFDVANKLKKLKSSSMGGNSSAMASGSGASGSGGGAGGIVNPIAEEAIRAAKASSALQNFSHERRGGGGSGSGGLDKKNKKTIRVAGGQVWEDPSLSEWADDDFRIFCGDLGNDVNDELLTRTFNKYPSFQKAKVLRDKRTGKSKGFGFISFKEPQDFIRAMKEMDGRYVGSRPIKLRKSNWKSRGFEAVKKRDQEKKALLALYQK